MTLSNHTGSILTRPRRMMLSHLYKCSIKLPQGKDCLGYTRPYRRASLSLPSAYRVIQLVDVTGDRIYWHKNEPGNLLRGMGLNLNKLPVAFDHVLNMPKSESLQHLHQGEFEQCPPGGFPPNRTLGLLF